MAKEKKAYSAGDQSFEIEIPGAEGAEPVKKKYSILVGRFVIPEFGERTAAELAVDEEAQKAVLAIEGQTIVQELV